MTATGPGPGPGAGTGCGYPFRGRVQLWEGLNNVSGTTVPSLPGALPGVIAFPSGALLLPGPGERGRVQLSGGYPFLCLIFPCFLYHLI